MFSLFLSAHKIDKTMGVYLAFLFFGVPFILFLIFCLTNKGKRWLRQNNLM